MVKTAMPGLKQIELAARVIHPGGWAVETEQPLATLLGSCVAVCLFDEKLRAAQAGDDPDVVLAGDYAMDVLVNAMLARGANRRRLVAKAFGGANVSRAIQASIGEKNAEFTVKWLDGAGIPLVASDFGGQWPRKLVLLPDTGDAYCRRQMTAGNGLQKLLNDEYRYRKRLDSDNGRSRVELFGSF
ncbi:MAG: hypothetical protein ABT05_08040 [Lautropia sp. SCN 66-9]|nr:MAG: hypothetical protein ABT05_08040 [Lautropia sp. SCN 66-9]